MTLAFSSKAVHEKLWKSVNICNSYSKKISGTLFFWTWCIYNIMTWKNRWNLVLIPNIMCMANYRIRPKFRLEHGSDQTLKPTMISTSIFFTTGVWSHLFMRKSHHWQIDERCKHTQACICDIGRQCLRFNDKKKNQVIFTKTLVWSPRD